LPGLLHNAGRGKASVGRIHDCLSAAGKVIAATGELFKHGANCPTAM